ncbi:alpha/beta hydrolase family protein [Asticcacaulis machinosus]|uniref:4-O-methyl-glucuronoyl methylesterase-like domain-containing protein n=1 Tax=Asticcacaulis machinosus TaxID=2984211 RepID=A0ABT5HM51_9CAUL|nr:hypothetical protein [Asticcacaulis machinosus]MDC7677329.1 hypothetical protein [Asticcacaulis machinosus]
MKKNYATLLILGALTLAKGGIAQDMSELPPALGPKVYKGVSLPEVRSYHEWHNLRAPLLKSIFQTEVYGRLPTPNSLNLISKTTVDEAAFGGLGRLEEAVLTSDAHKVRLHVAYVVPKTPGPHPVVIVTAFCGNGSTFSDNRLSLPAGGLPEFCARFKNMPPSATDDPDPYLIAPPVEALLKRGYAVASFSTADIVIDDKATAIIPLHLLNPTAPPNERLGAIAAWGWGYSKVIDFLETDPRFDPKRQAIYGHSRNGKAAISAAAFDKRIDLVFAHQSGRGGASLSRSPVGEQVSNITGGFPHWFAPNYARYGDDPNRLPVDQHELIGLIAPRPLLLGAGVDDQWADPEGAWQAAIAATPVYQLSGHKGLTQTTRETPNLSADIAYFLRPGRHGTTLSDWGRFMDFMDAHFKTPRKP